MDPKNAIPGTLLLVAGYPLIALSGRLHNGRDAFNGHPVTNAECAVLLFGAFALIGGLLLIGTAFLAASNDYGGSSPL